MAQHNDQPVPRYEKCIIAEYPVVVIQGILPGNYTGIYFAFLERKLRGSYAQLDDFLPYVYL